MEILSEEDIMAETAEEEMSVGGAGALDVPRSSEEAELRDLKDQFADQESLLGQLKNVLRSNEEKLHNKEKEVQVRQE
jgi:hypothetical protein